MEKIPFSSRDIHKDWVLRESCNLWYVIPSDLADQGYWGNCRRVYQDENEARIAFDDFMKRLKEAKEFQEEMDREALSFKDNTVNLLRELISSNAQVQHISHSYILSGKVRCKSDMEAIKENADKTRKGIRDLAQHLGVEY